MKLVIRIFALTVVIAGAAAAANTPKTAPPSQATSRPPRVCRFRHAIRTCAPQAPMATNSRPWHESVLN